MLAYPVGKGAIKWVSVFCRYYFLFEHIALIPVQITKYYCSFVETLFLCFYALYSDELTNTKSAMAAKDAEAEEKNTTIAQVWVVHRLMELLWIKYSS